MRTKGYSCQRGLLRAFSVGVSALFLLITPLYLYAQITTGSISGTVADANGNAIVDAVVNATAQTTGVSRSTNTDSDGSFRFTKVSLGRYDIEVVIDGAVVASNENVAVNIGTTTDSSFVLAAGDETITLDAFLVTGYRISPIDVASTESTTILSEETIDRIGVARNVTAVVLLAPGTTLGDQAFGNLASFGGASVAENAYFINGLDVTNFRNGLGGSTVPFEFYKEFQVKTGGYGAEFGRSTGGVVNAVTKSGSNEFSFGGGVIYRPNAWRGDYKDIYDNDGNIYRVRERDTVDFLNYWAYASGPIVKDKLFFYVLVNPRDNRSEDFSNGAMFDNKDNERFWGAKLDWFINDDHHIELTGWSDSRTTFTDTFNYDFESNTLGELVGSSLSNRGGDNYVVKYTGFFSDEFTLSALYGVNRYDLTDASPADSTCPLLIDARATSTNVTPGCWVNALPSAAKDQREQIRIDGELSLGLAHVLRFGYDSQTNNSVDETFYSGHQYWRYIDATSSTYGGVPKPPGVTELARFRIFEGGGDFDTISTAYYVEDTWSMTDDMVLKLGVRLEGYDNRNANGETFIKINNQVAPRLGFSWDINGDSSSKLFATGGRYHLPIASNTNVRLSGAEYFIQEYYLWCGELNSDGTPACLGDQLGTTSVFGDGTVRDVREILDQTIKPMYQDEFILGYVRDFGAGWSVGIRGIYRDLKSTIEDVAIDAALNQWALDNGIDFQAGGFDYYVLTNPGTDMVIYIDSNGDGEVTPVELSAEILGYPNSERTYKAVELFFEKGWNGSYFLQGSLTYSQSRGNNEGYVRSDNGQDDAGLTTLFDQPGLMDGAFGPLPNDRPLTFKLFGSWEFAENWLASGNFLVQSGRPINAFGVHPTDQFAAAYGQESFYDNSVLVPRGSRGRTPTIVNLDLGIQYQFNIGRGNLVLRADVYNVFDSSDALEVYELADDDPRYGIPTRTQTPRRFGASAVYEF